MSVILVLNSASCHYNEIDTRAPIRGVVHDMPRSDVHWSPCTRCYHVSDAALAVILAWASQYRHEVVDKREPR